MAGLDEQKPTEETSLKDLYKEAEIEETNENNTWLLNKQTIENLIYEEKIKIDYLENYSENLIAYYNIKIR